LKDVVGEGRSLFTNLGAAVIATGLGACSGTSLRTSNAPDAGAPDQILATERYPDGVPPIWQNPDATDLAIPPDLAADVAPDVAADRLPELVPFRPEAYPDGVPAMPPPVDPPRDAGDMGQPDRFFIIDGLPSIATRDTREVASERASIDQTAVDSGLDPDTK
jgi:hypothetical protein